jgi:abortive infection bacteriophage resistance protein
MTADKQTLISRLQSVNYYRLSAYWHPFKQPDSNFIPGTSLDTVWSRYTFDRQLRLLVMDAIERVEIAIRTRLAYELVHKQGAFAHISSASFHSIPPAEHRRLLDDLHENAQRSREAFVEHFKTTYDEFPDLPLWVAVETMMFGQMLTMFRHSGKPVQQAIAADYKITGTVLQSWLFTLNYIRNLCAHHSRLWNRELAIKPIIPDPRNAPDWHAPGAINNSRIFVVLTLLHYLMRHIAPQSHWRNRLYSLFDRYPGIPMDSMGFPSDWKEHPLWK